MSNIPVQYKSKTVSATAVIANTQDDKDLVEEAICKLLNIKKTKGNVTFGPPMSANEALIYNTGYEAGVAASVANTVIIHTPDLKAADGTVLISGTKRAKQ